MSQLLTLISNPAAVGLGAWRALRNTLVKQDAVAVRLRLDRSGPGSHLV